MGIMYKTFAIRFKVFSEMWKDEIGPVSKGVRNVRLFIMAFGVNQ